jgi:hypothetical protein
MPFRDSIEFNARQPSIGDLLWLSVTTVVPVGGLNTVTTSSEAVRAILTMESFVGIVLIGLVGAMLFRRIGGK